MIEKIALEIAELGEQGYHLFCKAKLNGKRVRVLIDTGASKSVIAKSFADKLTKLKQMEVPDSQTRGIGPEAIDANFVRIRTLRFGKVRFHGLIAGILDLSHVTAVYEELRIAPFDFLMGCDLLLELNAVIDLPEAVMSIQSGGMKRKTKD
ncbi:MAG: retropepsin-like domain-containing protein [Flavobacteriales bacterium]|nr:retropepsin-like domain-containing protein [Flavobacteriales bacterium]